MLHVFHDLPDHPDGYECDIYSKWDVKMDSRLDKLGSSPADGETS